MHSPANLWTWMHTYTVDLESTVECLPEETPLYLVTQDLQKQCCSCKSLVNIHSTLLDLGSHNQAKCWCKTSVLIRYEVLMAMLLKIQFLWNVIFCHWVCSSTCSFQTSGTEIKYFVPILQNGDNPQNINFTAEAKDWFSKNFPLYSKWTIWAIKTILPLSILGDLLVESNCTDDCVCWTLNIRNYTPNTKASQTQTNWISTPVLQNRTIIPLKANRILLSVI
jgi:hypothetical protein